MSLDGSEHRLACRRKSSGQNTVQDPDQTAAAEPAAAAAQPAAPDPAAAVSPAGPELAAAAELGPQPEAAAAEPPEVVAAESPEPAPAPLAILPVAAAAAGEKARLARLILAKKMRLEYLETQIRRTQTFANGEGPIEGDLKSQVDELDAGYSFIVSFNLL